MIDTIESCGFFESIPLWAVTLIGGCLLYTSQISDRFLSLAEQEKISVLLVPVGKSQIVKEIPDRKSVV